jgi:hypothetical protein
VANRVLVNDLSVTMELKNNGVRLQILDADGRHRGYLQVNRGFIRWFSGKAQWPCGKISLDEFIRRAEDGCL